MKERATRPTAEFGMGSLRKSVDIPKPVHVTTSMPTPLQEFNITLDRETAYRAWLAMHDDRKRRQTDSVIVGHLLDCKELLDELHDDPDAQEIIERAQYRLGERRRSP